MTECYSALKEWTVDTCYNMDELQNHAKSKKPVTKDFIIHDSIYIKCPEKANF